jgi:predicted TIM-barrel fold metal-dependent hydrolase
MMYRRISADCHIDLPWLPPDLFVSEAPQSLRSLMPYVVNEDDRLYWTTHEGRFLGLVNGVGPRGNPYVPGRNAQTDRIASTGLYEDGKKQIRRCTDPDLRLVDMQSDGIDAEVIYGILGVAGRMNKPAVFNIMIRIYNDWLHTFCSKYPDRQIGLANLPDQDIPAAVEETYRVAKLGFKGVELSSSLDMQPLCDPCWEPLWQALNETRMPLHLHTGFTVPWDYPEQFEGQTRRRVLFMLEGIFQIPSARNLGALIGAGVFQRYGNIKVVFGESGIGWIPYVLHRLDYEYEKAFQDLDLELKPSEYWQRQCLATFQHDPVGIKNIDDIGPDNVMWGADYPHADGVWPGSTLSIEDLSLHLPEDIVVKITCENARQLYRLG